MAEEQSTKTCIWCREVKSITLFHARRASKDGIDNRCKECTLSYSAKRRAAKPAAKRDSPAAYLSVKFGPPKRKRSGAFVICETCSTEFYIPPSRLRRNFAVRFCSMKCYDKKGDKNPFWGKEHSQPSIDKMMSSPSRPDASRLIHFNKSKWAGIIGCRKVKSFIDEVGECQRCGMGDRRILCIHHIDRNRKNNEASNLEILCPNCHALEHFLSRDGAYSQLKPFTKEGYCKFGHQMTGDNIREYVTPKGGRVRKVCRSCERERARVKRKHARKQNETQLRLL